MTENGPATLLTYLAAALDPRLPQDAGLADAIASPAVSTRVVVGRLLGALRDAASPLLLVIDYAHRIRDQAALDTLAVIVAPSPRGAHRGARRPGRRRVAVPALARGGLAAASGRTRS